MGDEDSTSGSPDHGDWSTNDEFRAWQEQADEQAFERLYRAYARDLELWVLKDLMWLVLKQQHSLEDIVQDIWCTVVATVGKNFEYQGKGSFRAWLKVVTRNHLATLCRRFGSQKSGQGQTADHLDSRVESEGSPKPGQSVPESPTSHARYVDLVERASCLLSRREFLAWFYVLVCGCTPSEAAVRMGEPGLTDSAVRGLVHRARTKLMRYLGDQMRPDAGGSNSS